MTDPASDKKPNLAKLYQKLEEKEREREKEFLEQSRPKIFGDKKFKWDGLLTFFENFWDNLIWKLYGDDVLADQRREENIQQKNVQKRQDKKANHNQKDQNKDSKN